MTENGLFMAIGRPKCNVNNSTHAHFLWRKVSQCYQLDSGILLYTNFPKSSNDISSICDLALGHMTTFFARLDHDFKLSRNEIK
jgi:hypothetical protein